MNTITKQCLKCDRNDSWRTGGGKEWCSACGAEQAIPAAACPRCGGWTAQGGCAQHAKATEPVLGRTGCTCVGGNLATTAAPTGNATKEEIQELILKRGLTLTQVIDVVCELNGFVGVGYITFAEQIAEYIKGKIEKRSAEHFLNT